MHDRTTTIHGETTSQIWAPSAGPVIHRAELRAITSGRQTRIVGYAAVFNRRSTDLGGYVEEILPGAFDAAVDPKYEILALMNHDTRAILARRTTGTLIVRQDKTGLWVEITPPDTTIGRDAVENVRAGNIKGMSFMFREPVDLWTRTSDGTRLRQIKTIGEVPEVTLTPVPAYKDTSASLKSVVPGDEAHQQREAWLRRTVNAMARERRLRLADAINRS